MRRTTRQLCHRAVTAVTKWNFNNGTVTCVARAREHFIMQHVVYNGHKREHDMTFQAVTKSNGLSVHLNGPEVAQRHNMYFYTFSDVEESLVNIRMIFGKQYLVYGNSGYS